MRTANSRVSNVAVSREYGYDVDGGGTRRRGRSMTAAGAGPIIADGTPHNDERKRRDEDCYHRHDGGNPATTNKRRAVSLGDNATGRSRSSGIDHPAALAAGGAGRGRRKKLPTPLNRRRQMMNQQASAAAAAAAVNNNNMASSCSRPTRRRSTTEEAKATAVDEELRNSSSSRRGRSITSRRSSLPPPPRPPVGISFRDRWHRSRSSFSNKKTTKKKKDGIVWNEIKHPTKSSTNSQFLRTWAINNSRSCSAKKKKKKKKNDGAPSKDTKLSRSSSSNGDNRRRETTSLKPKHYRQLIVNKLLNSDKPLLLGKEERGDRLLSQRRRNKSVPARLGHRVTWWNNSATTTNKEEKDSSTSDGSSTCEEYSSQSSEERRRSSSNTILRRGSSTSTSNPHVTKSPSNGIPRRTPTSSLTPHGRTPNSSATPRRRGGRPMSRHELRVAVTPIAGEEEVEEEMHYQAQHQRLPHTSDEIISRQSRRRSMVEEGRIPRMPFLNNKQQHYKQYHRGSDIEDSRRRRSMSMPPIYTRTQQQQQRPQRQESTGPVIYCDSLRTSFVSSLASMDSSWVYQRTKAHRDTIKLIETEIDKRLMAGRFRSSKFDLRQQQQQQQSPPPQPLLLPVITCDDNITNNYPISQIASVDSSWINLREKYKRRCRKLDEKRHQILNEFVSTIEKTTNSNNNKQLQLQVRRRASSCQPKLSTDGSSSIPLLSPPIKDSIAVRQEEEGPCVHNSNEETPKKRKHEFDISHLLTKDERKIKGITTSTVPSNMDISGSDVKTRTTTSRTGSSWDVCVPNPISSLPGSSYDRQLTNSTKTHSLQDVEIASVEKEGQVKTTTSPMMVSASDTGSSPSSRGGGYEAKTSTVCSSNKSVQSPCGSNALTLFGDNGTLRGHSKDGRSKDKPCLLDAKVSSKDVTDTASSLDSSSSNMCHVRCVFPENKIISSVVENDHDVTTRTNNSGTPYLTNKKFVVPPLHSEIRSKMPKHLSSYYEKEKKKAQHMDSLNESEISGLTLPVALRCPPKPPPQNLLKYARRSSSVHKESKNENNNNGSTADSADETAGSKVGLGIDINTNYTSQLSELSSPARVPPMLVEALVERYRNLSSHTKKKRQSQPVPTMREQVAKMTMEMPSSHHSYPPRDHVHSSSCSIREAGKDFPSKVLPPPPRDPMPGPPFVQNRYPNNKKLDDPPSSSRGWSYPQDLKPSINSNMKHHSRTQQSPRATTRQQQQQPMECEAMLYHQSNNDNKVIRKVSSSRCSSK